ncbi:hypothetical protein ACIO3O_39940 [Streptomyces sp. NPDC087440]|uniref:hypothetical protein n=1 Tax=Streptomyces sp. NPDC087440 TaxID=3365790 RepID=UPI00380ECAFF
MSERTVYHLTLRFRPTGPEVYGQWEDAATADAKFRTTVGLYATPGVTIELHEQHDGLPERLRRRWRA